MARTATLDEQGLAGCFLFPTLGMIYEEPLKHDPGAVCITFRAFNRWLLEDWGFDHQGRILTAPYLALADVEWAVEELEWALDHGARMIVMRTAAPTTVTGRHNPFDTVVRSRSGRGSNEAGITVVVHAGDSGPSSNGYAVDGFNATFNGGDFRPTIKSFAIEEAVHDYLLSMMLADLFARFPNLRVASIENGAEFLPDLFRKLRSQDKKMAGYFGEDPVEIFRRHVWINPFWEDDLADRRGADGCRPSHLRIGLAPHRSPAPPARLPAGHQAAGPRGAPEGAPRQRRRAGHPPTCLTPRPRRPGVAAATGQPRQVSEGGR